MSAPHAGRLKPEKGDLVQVGRGVTGRVLEVLEEGKKVRLDLPDGPRDFSAQSARVLSRRPTYMRGTRRVSERMREAHALHAAGMSNVAIAAKLGTHADNVADWLLRVEEAIHDDRTTKTMRTG